MKLSYSQYFALYSHVINHIVEGRKVESSLGVISFVFLSFFSKVDVFRVHVIANVPCPAIFHRLFTCSLKCLLACLFSCLLAFFLACLLSCLLTCLLTWLLACFLA